ncbi:hypothetical protein QBC43DRAFT_255852 [Cladorrhinum sp. PSN259]|nr:hypothetical protein QBC43DRAFT_255852 [Cladorrhinum sp. PSN259]
MDPKIVDFVQRFQALQGVRDSQEDLIRDLLVYAEGVQSALQAENMALVNKLQELQLDLEDATRSRRELQQHLQQMETHKSDIILENGRLKDTNPYVVVLIDGDGLFFKENLVRQGLSGGKQAAYGLRSSILSQCGAYAKNIEVVANIYVNLAGLCKAMRRDGSVDNESDMKDFSLGFTQAKASFDVIDVGHGKERADNKIKENTKWHLRNLNCKQVILGISHDAGYAPFLDELFQDPGVKVRITVLEGIPLVRELEATRVNILNLNEGLFRAEKLIDKIEQASSVPPTPTLDVKPAVPKTKTPVADVKVATVIKSKRDSVSSANSAGTATPATSTASTPVPTPATTVSATAAVTYARAIKTVTPPPPAPTITLPIKARAPVPKPAPPPKAAPWNPGARGLDPPLEVSQTALDNIKKRKDHNKLCNNHYLRGPCSKGDSCHFEHKYKPTKDELVAIAFLTRLNPCSQGQDCDVADCIYGHHCPSVINGICSHPFCKFGKEDHPPGTKFKPHKHERS